MENRKRLEALQYVKSLLILGDDGGPGPGYDMEYTAMQIALAFPATPKLDDTGPQAEQTDDDCS